MDVASIDSDTEEPQQKFLYIKFTLIDTQLAAQVFSTSSYYVLRRFIRNDSMRCISAYINEDYMTHLLRHKHRKIQCLKMTSCHCLLHHHALNHNTDPSSDYKQIIHKAQAYRASRIQSPLRCCLRQLCTEPRCTPEDSHLLLTKALMLADNCQ